VDRFTTVSAEETEQIGKRIGRRLKAGDIVALEGPLGSGKTTLVKGIAKGLGVKNEEAVASPTYVLIREYEARQPIYHMDWYRLSKVEGPDRLLTEECFNSRGITVVEWAERGKNLFPKTCIWIVLKYEGLANRAIEIVGLEI